MAKLVERQTPDFLRLLVSAQVMTLGFWDQLHWALHLTQSLLVPLPLFLPQLTCSLSQINKILFKKKKAVEGVFGWLSWLSA